jgi:SAM-dependent methyltransferase
VTFTCNICGATCERGTEPLQREHEDCPHCRSSVRIRALIALLSKEIFGTLLTLPEFPVLKGIRAIGMSDSPELAERLAAKFDYTNTFYDQAPRFDVTTLDPRDEGRYDFILSSEVLEHVPPPVEQAFANLHRMLKPDGMLLMTTPYNLGGLTREHFPDLHQYTLASLGGRAVLVNRKRDGSIETFEHLTFHHAPTETVGGHGSALEVRVFTETSLRAILCNAAFSSVQFAADSVPEFGVDHAESWSLPIAARKGTFHPPAAELALQYREAQRLAARKIGDLEAITAEYERHVEHHNQAHEEWLREAALRSEWVKRVEAAWEERTAWALEIQKARDEAIAEFRRVAKSEAEAWQAVETLSKNLEQANANLAALSGSKWTRLGRKLGLL